VRVLQFFKIFMILVLIVAVFSCKQKEEAETKTTEAKASRVLDVSEVTSIMKVEEIDLEHRLFTLSYDGDNLMVVRAANDLTGIENIKIGDKVSVTYIKSTAVYVTSPDSTRAAEVTRREVQVDSKDGKPRKLEVEVHEKLSIVEALDLENRMATLKHSDGTVETIKVSDKFKGLEKVKVGDHVIYQFTQAVAVDIAKVE
jgi:hypothetical protein